MAGRSIELAAGRWWTLGICAQLGNVGSEVSRALRWQGGTPISPSERCSDALDRFDLTLDDPAHRQAVARLREIARAREVVVDFLAGANEYRSAAESLQKYFDAYAVAARR